jgi:hypothetical protein
MLVAARTSEQRALAPLQRGTSEKSLSTVDVPRPVAGGFAANSPGAPMGRGRRLLVVGPEGSSVGGG